MHYTTTANFAMTGASGKGINTGVINRITGNLGDTVNKAKSWLQKTGTKKQELSGSATIAKNRLKPQSYVSPNAGIEDMARKKYGGSEAFNTYKQNSQARLEALKNKSKNSNKSRDLAIASEKLNSSAALRTNLTEGSARQINRGSSDRFSKSGSEATINDNRSLRVKYTRDPRTGKLVAAAYSSPISLLCDL